MVMAIQRVFCWSIEPYVLVQLCYSIGVGLMKNLHRFDLMIFPWSDDLTVVGLELHFRNHHERWTSHNPLHVGKGFHVDGRRMHGMMYDSG
jgi:hypothetical protein